MAEGWPQAQGPRYGSVGPGPADLVAKLPRHVAGAAGGGPDFLPSPEAAALGFGGLSARKRLSGFAVLQVLALPIGVFVGVMWVNSFTLRYEHPQHAAFVTVCGLFVGIICGARCVQVRLRAARDPTAGLTPDWLPFVCAACLIAWLAALILGTTNYSANMSSYYELSGLSIFRDVHPSDIPATKYMDAAAIYFRPGTVVSQSLSLGFKNSNTYCVAPIVSGNASDAQPASYDFWAVGLDCCVPMPPASFYCGGQTNDNRAHAALRWMRNTDREFFRLGISQAQAEYHYMAANPVLFTWTRDPEADILRMAQDGRRYFVVSCVAFSVLHAVVTSVVVYFYSMQLTGGKMPTIP